jgi:hypothetical protein
MGSPDGPWHIDTRKLQEEMRRLGIRGWSVRFADVIDLEAFFGRFVTGLERHPQTGDFGRWLNPFGRWDWWDLGGRFDGRIVGERRRTAARRNAKVSSGPNAGRTLLARVEDQLAAALGQESFLEVDVHTDQNIELVATLLEATRAGCEDACPSTLVLPPGAVSDQLRWIRSWPQPGPDAALEWLGMPSQASWASVVSTVYAHFVDHWAAGVAYHH